MGRSNTSGTVIVHLKRRYFADVNHSFIGCAPSILGMLLRSSIRCVKLQNACFRMGLDSCSCVRWREMIQRSLILKMSVLRVALLIHYAATTVRWVIFVGLYFSACPDSVNHEDLLLIVSSS
jgi:hypothetical protein